MPGQTHKTAGKSLLSRARAHLGSRLDEFKKAAAADLRRAAPGDAPRIVRVGSLILGAGAGVEALSNFASGNTVAAEVSTVLSAVWLGVCGAAAVAHKRYVKRHPAQPQP